MIHSRMKPENQFPRCGLSKGRNDCFGGAALLTTEVQGETMTKDIFEERERAEEAIYFRAQDEKLIQKLRENAKLEEIVKALAGSVQANNPELLRRVAALGVTLETGPAFLLAPLVQVAWANGRITDRERETVLRLAGARGIEEGSPARAQLLAWLQKRPADALFDTAMEVIKAGLAVVPQDLRED